MAANYLEHLPYNLLSERKNDSTAGTFESNAFILSLKDKNEFSTLHSFGYHRVPLVGQSIDIIYYVYLWSVISLKTHNHCNSQEFMESTITCVYP